MCLFSKKKKKEQEQQEQFKPRSDCAEIMIIRANSGGVIINVYVPISFNEHEKRIVSDIYPGLRELRRSGWGNTVESSFIYDVPNLDKLDEVLKILGYDPCVTKGYDKEKLNLYFRRSTLHKCIDEGLGDSLGLMYPLNVPNVRS
jgi:hypothetical protein